MTVGFVTGGATKTGATTTVDLGTPLYVIEAKYFDPIKKAEQPLPAHYWSLYQPDHPATIFAGGGSTADGKSTLLSPKDGLPAGEYALALFPLPDDVRAGYASQGEAYIDLDKNEWVAPPPAGPRLDHRKLLRLPAWTTVRKITTHGGGFVDAPPKAKAYFDKSGKLRSKEIEPYGTASTPWKIALDHGWMRAHVRYRFINWKDGKEETLPPGLVVEAIDDDRRRLGVGTAIDPADGTVYVLVSATRDNWKRLHFGFRAPPGTRVDLSAAASNPDRRLTAVGPIPPDRTIRNTLPNEWHSHGMRARYATSAGGTLKPDAKVWKDLRQDIAGDSAATDPLLEFHLDDVALWDDGLASVKAASRYTLFDHLLAIRSPDAAEPHFSTGTISSPYLPALSAYTVSPSPTPKAPTTVRDLSTRVIVLRSKLYDLAEKRVAGTPGKTEMLGARAAVINDHPRVDYSGGSPYLEKEGFFEIHFIDVPGVQDPVAGKPLGHLLLYVPCAVDLKGVSASDFYKMLAEASTRWSQGSPGVPGPVKDYRIVPKDPLKRKGVIRLRAFFGISDKSILNIEMEQGTDNRSYTRGSLWFLSGPKLVYYETALKSDASGLTGAGSDSDGVSYTWHTLAHEFGHVLALPDEYGEELDPKDVDPSSGITNPRVPGYSPPKEGMPTDYRPFFGDGNAIMKSNRLPRLRHVRHHVQALSADPAFASVPGRPFVIRHETIGGGLEYVRPIDERKHPYTAEFDGEDIPSGNGECALFPVGQDEGVAEAMFVPPGTASPSPLPVAKRFDGLVLVRPRVRFRFDGPITPRRQWLLIHNDFIARIYDPDHRSYIRFALQGGSKLSRIAIVIHPLCAYGRSLRSDHVKLVIGAASLPPANPFAAAKVDSSLDLDIAHFNVFSVLRLVLGVPTSSGTPRVVNTTPLAAADFANVAYLVDRKLGDKVGTRTVVPI